MDMKERNVGSICLPTFREEFTTTGENIECRVNGWICSPSVHSALNIFSGRREFFPERWQANASHVALFHVHLLLQEDQGQVVRQTFWIEIWMSDDVLHIELFVLDL